MRNGFTTDLADCAEFDQSLHAAQERTDERPLHVGCQRADRSRVPAIRAAVDRDRRLRRIVCVIDVPAPVRGQRDLLTPRSDPPEVPFGGRERALRVLAFDP